MKTFEEIGEEVCYHGNLLHEARQEKNSLQISKEVLWFAKLGLTNQLNHLTKEERSTILNSANTWLDM